MPKKFSAEFRLRAVAFVRVGGKTITQTAYELGVSAAALHNWVRQEEAYRQGRNFGSDFAKER
jgi:transposase-like protein